MRALKSNCWSRARAVNSIEFERCDIQRYALLVFLGAIVFTGLTLKASTLKTYTPELIQVKSLRPKELPRAPTQEAHSQNDLARLHFPLINGLGDRASTLERIHEASVYFHLDTIFAEPFNKPMWALLVARVRDYALRREAQCMRLRNIPQGRCVRKNFVNRELVQWIARWVELEFRGRARPNSRGDLEAFRRRFVGVRELRVGDTPVLPVVEP